MYRVFLRHLDGQIVGETSHPSTASAARQAFADLVNQTKYDGFELAAVLTEHQRVIAVHRFDRIAGDAQFWRNRLDQLAFSPLH